MSDEINIYGVVFIRDGQPEVVSAKASLRSKTVRIHEGQNRGVRRAWDYRTVVPLEDAHRTPEDAISSARRDIELDLEVLMARVERCRVKLAALDEVPHG